ncbi:MAG: gamma-glutamylcyclotransferase family protein [Balneolaceae bacterium]|nr:gamma-glutamylcyclotransferase family protein [Balneolaceae bacterium]
MSAEYLFVYGSLRRDFSSPASDVLDNHAEYIGEATFQGKLYKIDWYPGVVSSDDPDDIVVGEVYKMNDKERVLSKLDRYEGCSPVDPEPHAFTRTKTQVKLKNGDKIKAWIYLYNLSTSEKKRIPSGDFVTFKNRR